MYAPLLLALLVAGAPPEAGGGLRIEPDEPVLRGAEARQQLLVTAFRDGQPRDATDAAVYTSSDPAVARVSAGGVVFPVGNGTATITAAAGGEAARVVVRVEDATQLPALHFRHDIIPLLTKAGCNSGGCHGKQNGQNGFQLSVFGHDPPADFQALTQEGRGRRLFPAAPGNSLMLTKATNRVPHGGGRRLAEESPEYRRLLRWVLSGTPAGDPEAPHVVALDVRPRELVLPEESRQRLLVTARLSDGSTRDVTHAAEYRSNDENLAAIDAEGRIATGRVAGETALVVRYQEQVAACFVAVPLNPEPVGTEALAQWDRTQFIDRLLAEKWERLHLSPSVPADDATFHRRVSLDVIGRLPTPEEARAFLADARPDKRTRLIDALLLRPEYADFWALRWADLLRINREELGPRPAYRYHQWLRESLARNQPYHEFLRDVLTAQGPDERSPAVNFYRAFATPNDLTVAVSQVFLGVRLDCARCHHHPYEKWGQEDFYGLAAFFPRVQKKAGTPPNLTVFIGPTGDVRHPRTGQVVPPRVLLGEPLDAATLADPRARLADWMADPANPFVARALVNRVWAHLMGRGLVEPIDDMRDTNPATNEPLLAALAADFVAHGYDVRRLIRTIVGSRAYALSSVPSRDNVRDVQNYSRAYRKRLSAEVLLDAVCDVTGEAESFAGMPPGTRALQLWDHRLPSAFLDTFGRPLRKTVCQCERVNDATLGQVLHLMNAPLVNDKITSPTGRVAQLLAAARPPEEIVAELYFAALGRPPRPEELTAALTAFQAPDATPRQAAEDVLWALLNSAEFVLNH